VFRVAGIYAAFAFVIWQAADFVLPAARLPDWAPTLVLALTLIGFPIALVLAWAFDVTAQGVRRTESETAETVGVETQASTPTGAKKESIVVLPFDNMSPDSRDAYLADGLTEEIITDLSCCGVLRVISRNSAMALKGAQKDTRTIAGELGVQYVLEGSVRKAENDLRITAQLIDARADEHIWAERYAGTVDDLFDMQERVSRAIVRALNLRLSPEEERRLRERPIEDAHAYECYLRARQEIGLFTPDALDRAAKYLENAVDIIGDNALLYAGMGYVYAQYVNLGVKHEEYVVRAEEYAVRALELNPESCEANLVLGFLCAFAFGDQRKAYKHLKQALTTNPDDPHALLWQSNVLMLVGRTSDARPLARRLRRVDPLTPLSRFVWDLLDFYDGEFASALDSAAKWFQVEPKNLAALLWYAVFLAYNERYEEVCSLVEGHADANSTDAFTQWCFLVKSAAEGDTENVARLLNRDAAKVWERDAQFAQLTAGVCVLAGLKNEALDWLDKAVGRGLINYPWCAEHDLFLKKFRGDDRFEEILKRVKYEWERFES
jgi:TolB-like protein